MNLCLHLGLNSFHFDEIFHKQGKKSFLYNSWNFIYNSIHFDEKMKNSSKFVLIGAALLYLDLDRKSEIPNLYSKLWFKSLLSLRNEDFSDFL